MASVVAVVLSLLAATEVAVVCCDAEQSELVRPSTVFQPEASSELPGDEPHVVINRQASGGVTQPLTPSPCFRQLNDPLRPIPRRQSPHHPARLRRQMEPVSPSVAQLTSMPVSPSLSVVHQTGSATQQSYSVLSTGLVSTTLLPSSEYSSTYSLSDGSSEENRLQTTPVGGGRESLPCN